MLGFNEAYDSSFEKADTLAGGYYESTTNVVLSQDASTYHPSSIYGYYATHSLKAVATVTLPTDGFVHSVRGYRLHAPGERCVISMFVKGTAGNQLTIQERVLDRFGANVLLQGTVAKTFTLTGGWDYVYTNSFTVPDNSFFPGWEIYSTVSQTWWMDDWAIEEGPLPSTYFPAPQERVAGALIKTLGSPNTMYEWNALLMGATFTDIFVEKVTGLLGKAELRTTDQERQDAWGDYGGIQEYKARHIGMDLKVRADTTAIAEMYVRTLERVFDISAGTPGPPYPFVFQRPTMSPRFLWAKLEKFDLDSTFDLANRLITASVMLKCDDPRMYSLDTASWNLNVNDTQVSNAQEVQQAGNTDAFPVFVITGPADNPQVINTGDGGKFVKVTYALAAGHQLTIDMRSRTVTADTGVDLTGLLTTDSRWWTIKPGLPNLITYHRDSSSGVSSAALSFRDTWV